MISLSGTRIVVATGYGHNHRSKYLDAATPVL